MDLPYVKHMADPFKTFHCINCMIKITIAVINNPRFPGQIEKIDFLYSSESETEQLLHIHFFLNGFLYIISSSVLLELCQDQSQ